MSVRRIFFRTRTVVICDERKDIFPSEYVSQFGFQCVLFKSSFTTQSFQWMAVQVCARGTSGCSIVSHIFDPRLGGCRVHICGPSSLECENSGRLPTNVLARTLILRCMFLLPYQEVWKSCPSMLPIEQLMRLVR